MKREHALWMIFGIAILLAGAWVRFASMGQYNFWGDEAWVALSIQAASVRAMLFPDWHVQSTPPLFLLIIRFLTMMIGESEAAFRLVPAFFGTVSIGLIGLLTYQWSRSRPAALIAVVLWAFHPLAVLYAQELKQYTTDACVVLALLSMSEWHRNKGGWQAFGFLLIAALISMSLSHPAVFVLPAIAVRMMMHPTTTWKQRCKEVALFTMGTSVFFTLHYVFIVRAEQDTSWLFDFWNTKNQFLPLPFSVENIQIIWHQIWKFTLYGLGGIVAEGTMQTPIAMLGIAAAGVGWLHLIRRQPHVGVMPAMLFLTVLAASMLKLYPFGNIRLSLFLIPIAVMMASIGFAQIKRVTGRTAPVVFLMFITLGIPLINADVYAKKPYWMVEQMQPLLQQLQQERDPSTPLFVHHSARFSYRFYAEGKKADREFIGQWIDTKPTITFVGLRQDMLQFCANHPPKTRAWVIAARHATYHDDILKDVLQPEIHILDAFKQEGTAAYLLQCERKNTYVDSYHHVQKY